MEATDLMIEDWVYLNSESERRKGYYKVDFIHTGEIGIRGFNEHREVRTVTPPYLEPIHLTEDILKANGFVGSIRDCYVYNCGCYLIDVRCEVGEIDIYNEKGHYTSGYVCKSVNVDCFKYVHEFQHALRLCGLVELADNFKVE